MKHGGAFGNCERTVQQREAHIESEKEFNQRLKVELESKMGLYSKKAGLDSGTPENQIHAFRMLSNRVSELYESLGTVYDRIQALKNATSTLEERVEVEEEYTRLKGRLLGEMALFMEVMSPEDASTIKINGSEATIRSAAEQLPEILGILKSDGKGGKSCFIEEWSSELKQDWKVKDFRRKNILQQLWIDELVETYESGLEKMYDIGFLKGDSRDIVDFKSYYNSKEDREDYANWIMKHHFGVRTQRTENNVYDKRNCLPLRNFRKDQGNIIESDISIPEDILGAAIELANEADEIEL